MIIELDHQKAPRTMRSGRDAASSVTMLVTQYQSAPTRPDERRVCALCFFASGEHAAGDIGDRRARKLLRQSLDCRRCGLAQNRKDMSADRAGCARGRPVLGDEFAAFHRSEDIAQSDVA